MRIKVVYSQKMDAVSGSIISPSAHKPGKMAEYLKSHPVPGLEIEFVDPIEMTREDFYRVHEKQFVDDILDLKKENGFGTISKSVCDALPFTNGSMYAAVLEATATAPSVALCSGFHHAEWSKAMGFCTFNGLMVSAAKFLDEKGGFGMKFAIVDCDHHYGNGTDDILNKMQTIMTTVNKQLILGRVVGPFYHASFGSMYQKAYQSVLYLRAFERLRDELEAFKPDAILYQSGADVHVDDPYGGLLTEEQMYERDVKMFRIAKDLKIPLAWNLAGGYQVDFDGSIGKVLKLHLNTFKACAEVYEGIVNGKETEEARAEREAEESRNEAETESKANEEGTESQERSA